MLLEPINKIILDYLRPNQALSLRIVFTFCTMNCKCDSSKCRVLIAKSKLINLVCEYLHDDIDDHKVGHILNSERCLRRLK